MLLEYPKEILDFYKPCPVVTCLMKRMGYNFNEKMGLKYGKGVRAQLMPSMPKGNDIDYYHRTRRGL